MKVPLLAAVCGLKRFPVTVGLVSLISAASVVVSVNTPADTAPPALVNGGFADPDQWWSVVSSLITVPSVGALALLLPVLVGVLAGAEKVMGGGRVLLTYFIGGLAAFVTGAGASFVEEQYFDLLPLNAPANDTLSPVAALTTTAIAASSFAGALWRRRVRLLTLLVALTLFLYSGSSNDLFVIVAIPVGLVAGFVLGGRKDSALLVRSSHHEKRVLVSALVFVSAAGPVVASLAGAGAGLLSIYGLLAHDPVSVATNVLCSAGSLRAPCPDISGGSQEHASTAGLVALLPVIVAGVSAWGLFRGRRAALWLAVATNLGLLAVMGYRLAVTQPATLVVLSGTGDAESKELVRQTLVGNVVAVALPAVVVVTLLLLRRNFAARSMPAARTTFAATVAVAGLAALYVYLTVALFDRTGFAPATATVDLAVDFPARVIPPTLLPAESLRFVPISPWAQLGWYGPSVLFWMVVTAASARLVFSPRAALDVADRQRVQALIKNGGGDSLSHMATWQGNSCWFSPDLDAGFAFRVRGAIVVTLGEAFGSAAHEPTVIRQFIEFCGRHGWTPIFYCIEKVDSAAYQQLGWQRLLVADQAVLNPSQWTTSGRARQNIRTATNRAAREGLTASWTTWRQLDRLEQVQIREISEGWVGDKGLPEMEFTLGGVDEITHEEVKLLLISDPSGRIHAVTSWLPVYGSHGVLRGFTLDFMRRRADSMHGVMEFAISEAALQMKADGLRFMSLSGSPLASTRAETGEGEPVARILNRFGERLEPGYGFRSLLSFKRKFQPTFVSMWLLYPDASILPSTAIAIARSYLPDLTLRQATRLLGTLRKPSAAMTAGAGEN